MKLIECITGSTLRMFMCASLVAFLAAPGLAQAPVPNMPVLHRELNAGDFVQAGAAFGGWVGMGKSQGIGDQGDDVFICATAEAIATPASVDPVEGTGAGYLFVGAFLVPTPLGQHFQPTDEQIDGTLDPLNPIDEDIGLGLNDTDFGNVRGPGFPDLLFVPAAHVDRADDVAGAVNVWDTTTTNPTLVFQILEPPLDGYCAVVGGGDPPPDCPDTPAGRFGHSCAIADVDGDGFNDLVVGASASTEPADASCTTRVVHGRVYIFFGHATSSMRTIQVAEIRLDISRAGFIRV